MTQWLREIRVEYGANIPGSAYGPLNPWTLTSKGDEDFRIQFSFNRTNTNRADTGRLAIYNLPLDYANSIHAGVQEANDDRATILKGVRFRNDPDARNNELRELAEANLVKIFAGHRDNVKQIFQGDITQLRVKSLSSNVDSITAMELGDTIIPLKYGWLHKSFGGGATLDKVLSAVVTAGGVRMSQQGLKFLSTTVAGVDVTEYRNGVYIQGGLTHNFDEIVAKYGVQWFIRNGEFFLMPRKALIDDFRLRLDEGVNVLRPVGKLDGEDIMFTMLLDGDMLPGRGFRIWNTEGTPTSNHGYRADTVQYIGDTHGNPWYCKVVGSRVGIDNWPDPFIAITKSEAFADTENVAVP